MNRYQPNVLCAACAVAVLVLSGTAIAADPANNVGVNNHRGTAATNAATPSTERGDARDEARGAAEDVAQSVNVIDRMKRADPALDDLLQHASGVFVVPRYGRVALGVGGRGGVGLLLKHNGQKWSDPAFYNFGGISAGLEAGAEGGSFVLVLNNSKAINSFMQDNNWSLNAGAGLTIVNWSKKALGSAGMGDVTVWSDTKGLFGGATISLTDINYDEDQTAAYYGGKAVAVRNVLSGALASTEADRLKQALADTGSAGRTAANGTGNRARESATSTSGMREAPSATTSTSPNATDRNATRSMESPPK